MHRQVASWCAPGASDRSMPRTRGEIPCVSSKRELFTRGSDVPYGTLTAWIELVFRHGPEARRPAAVQGCGGMSRRYGDGSRSASDGLADSSPHTAQQRMLADTS